MNSYNEKIGQEGRAREQLLIAAFKQGWIRIRRYGDTFWSVIVGILTSKTKAYLNKWARAILKGTKDYKEEDRFNIIGKSCLERFVRILAVEIASSSALRRIPRNDTVERNLLPVK